ncbi:UbiX family flavin prenyltransferase [Streptomyces sp. NPDC001455]|uniref:UbiX family flavin prenyltransferase n=1 Tax=unclassified Streptomyces TaxID=2593676 RepID=UPI00332D5EBD
MTSAHGKRRLVVGISGSSAPQLGIAMLRALAEAGTVETHLVISHGARRCIQLETDLSVGDVAALADVVHNPADLAASISSGSFQTVGMAVVPCSARTLAAVATGNSDNLLTRAADVTLKERRPLVLAVRETPLSLIHIQNMKTVTLAGATVLPPVPAFYHGPRTVDDILRQTAGKILDQFGIGHDLFVRWKTPEEDR